MKAIVVREFGAPEVMKIEEVDTPVPTGTQVLVKVEAIGVNPVETYIRSGNYPSVPSLPYTPGKDAAGTVYETGPDVTRWSKGDRVYTAQSESGAYAEFTLVNEVDLAKLPENVSFEKGAGVWTPYATAYRALFQKAHTQHSDTVLVHGASGGVGNAAVQWAKRAGIRVFGTASSAEGQQLVRDLGADAVFDHSKEGYLAEIMDATSGHGVDVIIEMLANENLQKDFQVLAMRGRIVVVGNRGSLEFNPRQIMGKDAAVYGMALYNSSYFERDEMHNAIFTGLAEGTLDPMVSRQFPLAEAAAAHHAVMEQKAFGKTVLIP